MLKLLIVFNIALVVANLLLFLLRGDEDDKIHERATAESASSHPGSTTPATNSDSTSGGGITSQLGAGAPRPSPPVVTADGESWHLSEWRLKVALQDAVTGDHPPYLEEQFVADLGLDAQQQAAINQALSDAAQAMMDCERAGRELRTDDEGKRFVFVAEYKDEAKQIFADLQAAMASASDPDSAAVMMIAAEHCVYFRKRGEEGKLTLGELRGKPYIQDWRGDWVHRWGGFEKSPFGGCYDHILDLEELGWSAD